MPCCPLESTYILKRKKKTAQPTYPNHFVLIVRPKVFFCFVFINLVCETIGTAATTGLLCQPRVIMKMIAEKQMECRLAGGTEVLGGNLPQCHFCPSQYPT
jgi:hypothetical protein